jgi:hypothetical protein
MTNSPVHGSFRFTLITRLKNFLPLLFLLSAGHLLTAQSMAGLGALHGTVTDPQGAVIANGSVIVANPSLGIVRNLTASSDGIFEASSLPPASGYEITVKVPGFATYIAKGIVVHVGEDTAIPIAMEIAQQAETVSVDASAQEMDVSDSGVSERHPEADQ